jgi:heptosyltransferase-2/heptosyltransferase-3
MPELKISEVGESAVDGKYIVLSGGFQKAANHANWKNKAWPHWKQCAQLLKERGHRLVTVGVKEECEPWHKELIDFDLCGKTDLVTLAATIRKAAGMIACDNGPAHIADAYKVKTVVLFGPTSLLKNRYFNTRIMFAPQSVVQCRPCQHNIEQMSTCNNAVCMLNIHPEQVVDVLEYEMNPEQSV